MLFVISSSHLTSSPPRQDNAFGKSSIDVHQEISNFHFSKLQWDSGDYSLPLLSDPVHMTATHIPLIHVFNGNVAEHWCGKLFLPPSHCTNNKDECKQQLWPLIFRQAEDCGFNVKCRFRNFKNDELVIRVQCICGESYNSKNKSVTTPNHRNTFTAKPQRKNDLCNFSFYVRYHKYLSRWYVRVGDKTGRMSHSHHMRQFVNQKAKNMTQGDRVFLQTLVHHNFSPRDIVSIMKLKNGKDMDYRQIESVKHHALDTFVKNEDGSKPLSSGQRVLNYVRHDPTISYLAVMGDAHQAMSPSLRML